MDMYLYNKTILSSSTTITPHPYVLQTKKELREKKRNESNGREELVNKGREDEDKEMVWRVFCSVM